MTDAPGVFLKRELATRGWDQGDLAMILDRAPRLISELVNGKRGLTARTAHELAAAFGDDPMVWMIRDTDYRLSKAKDPDPGIKRRLARIEKRDVERRVFGLIFLALLADRTKNEDVIAK